MEALCREQTLDPHERYTLVCGRGNDRNDCVPQCTPALHGDILMLNIDGSDRKYSCEMHDDKYSWMGSTAFGGYVRILSSPKLLLHFKCVVFILLHLGRRSVWTPLLSSPPSNPACP